VANVSKQLGREFGSEARVHAQDLADRLRVEYEQLGQRIEGHEQQWRNNISAVVQELLAAVSQRIDDSIAAPLRAAGDRLEDVAATLPAAAEQLAEARESWGRAQAEALAGWSEVARRTEQAAGRVVEMNDQLGAGVGTLLAVARDLQAAHGGLDQVLERQSQFVRQCIDRLLARRPAAAGGNAA
jgi:ABC-type transporter Mla subunit MlaD